MTQSQLDPPVLADRASRRSATHKRRTSVVLLLVPVVLVAIGVLAFLVLGGDGDGGVLGIGGDDDAPSDEVPAFEFKLSKTDVVPTAVEADAEALQQQADAIAEDVTPLLDDLYTDAFLDPANWRDGDYEEIFEAFTDEAAASARGSVETLTLGATAGEVYETVTPRRGTLRYSVLFDQDGNAATVAVEVRFSALGERTDGTWVEIRSEGELFLQDEGGWRITAFDVQRDDQETTAPKPSTTASGSVSPSSSR